MPDNCFFFSILDKNKLHFGIKEIRKDGAIFCYIVPLSESVIFLVLSTDMIPTRLNIGIMSFLITFISYVLRANVALSMLAMVKPTHTNVTAPDVCISQSDKFFCHLSHIILIHNCSDCISTVHVMSGQIHSRGSYWADFFGAVLYQPCHYHF